MVRILTVIFGALLLGCANGTKGGAGLEEIPPIPEGFTLLPTTPTGFRSAKIEREASTWAINFEDGIIKVAPFPFNVTKLDPKWYPEEGGAAAARCRGYVKGDVVMIRLEGSSDRVTEETRIFFENNQLREVEMYSLPGEGLDPENPPENIPYSQRVKRQKF